MHEDCYQGWGYADGVFRANSLSGPLDFGEYFEFRDTDLPTMLYNDRCSRKYQGDPSNFYTAYNIGWVEGFLTAYISRGWGIPPKKGLKITNIGS